MRKSVPVSEDLDKYFANPCPVLSDNNSRMILNEISKGYNYVVEYGLGASTLYLLDEAQRHEGKFISVENNYNWFEICIDEITKKTDFVETKYTKSPWSIEDIRSFIKGYSHPSDVPEDIKRFPNWKDSLSLGPFFRFSPNAKSRFSGKLGPFWPLSKPALRLLAGFFYMFLPALRPCNGEWIAKKDNLDLILRNVGPSIKDQFGEAPNMIDYINAGIKDIRKELEDGCSLTALFIIDGGPRHKIVQEIFDLEDKYEGFIPTIILCDANRAFYHETLKKRSSGRFLAGTNRTLKGDPVETGVSGSIADFWAGGKKTGDELSQQEVWYYTRSRNNDE